MKTGQKISLHVKFINWRNRNDCDYSGELFAERL